MFDQCRRFCGGLGFVFEERKRIDEFEPVSEEVKLFRG